MAKKICDVLATKDYDLFSFLRGNREIDRANVDKIKESMQKEQLVIPIVVNSSCGIVDGQHRYTAAKELGLPVYYIMQEDYGINQVLLANTNGSKKWTNEDFLIQHVELGNEDYVDFRNMCQVYGIAVSEMMKIFCTLQGEKTSIFKKNFRNGNFVLDEKEKVVKFLLALEKFNIGEFSKHYKKSNFISAFLKLYTRSDYDQKIMENKLETNSFQLKQCATSKEYLSLICNQIYSYGGNKKAIYFSAETGKFFNK